ncbi:MAG: 50S ribosomal protein L11 methyltransferase [Eubacteriales bacterium]
MDITWLEVAITTTPDQLDTVCAQLAVGGMDTISIEDEGDFRRFLEENKQYWDFVDEDLQEKMRGLTRVKFYVTDNADGKEQLARYTAHLHAEYTLTPLAEHDWAYSWQKYYTPIEIGSRLIVVPEWERESPIPTGRTPLYLNPGLTFGTGSHATTNLCLTVLDRLVQKGDTVLDLGCGSGILSIATLVLGAVSALAVDIDPLAVGVATENAQLNDITTDQFTVLSGNLLADEALFTTLSQQKYKLIVANIVADVILSIAPTAIEFLTEDGIFLCSGIIDTRSHEVETALRELGFTSILKHERNGWVAFECSQ